MLTQLAIAVLVVDSDGYVTYANPAALELFGDGRQPRLLHDRLVVTTSSELQKKLDHAIASVASGCSSDDVAFVVNVDVDVAMIVCRLDQRPLALVLATSSKQQLQFVTEVFRRTHGLTPAEAAVVATFLERPSTAALAEGLDVSTNTTRTHLKRVFEKMQVHTRTELMRSLLIGPLRLLRLVR